MKELNEEINTKSERNYGIDLLRIIAMFFVVVLHCLGQGGILNNAITNSPQYKFAWFMEICAYCAVNMFALISGYVSYRDKEKKVNYSNYINLWLQVVFYGILVTLIYNLTNMVPITKRDYFMVLFPVTNGLYWYFTAYTGLFVIMPFLNKGIRNCSTKTLKKLFVVIILAFSVFDIISNRFVLNYGYSFIWIVLLYILGATIKKCEIGKSLKWYQILIGILLFYIATYLYKMYGFEGERLNVKITKALLVSYTSPTIIGAAILYVIGFSKIKFNNILKKIIKFAAPSAFSIYLLNNHRLIWNNLIAGLFKGIANSSIINIFVNVVGFTCIFVISSILIDKIRILLFKACHVKELSDKISNLLNNAVNKISEFI